MRLSSALAALFLAAAAPKGEVVALSAQPGSALDNVATKLVGSDLQEARKAGDTPLLLVGSARISTAPGAAALFVQIQSASFCGSAGCSTSVYVKRGRDWRKVLDSVSGPIRVSPRVHGGMHDLLVDTHDRWVWTGKSYADTLPAPAISLKPG